MVVHNPLVLVLPRAARDRCSPMVCILYFNLENSIGQEEEVWDLGVGFFPCPWHLFVFVAVCCLGGGDGDMRMAGPAKGALTWATQNLCLGAGHCLQTGLGPEGPQGGGNEERQSLFWEDHSPNPDPAGDGSPLLHQHREA